MLVGYPRVSTGDQTVDLQKDALAAATCGQVFTDVTSGAKASRPGLDAELGYVREGDTLVVWRLDRLGRSLPHLIETISDLAARGVEFHSLTESLDTTKARSRYHPGCRAQGLQCVVRAGHVRRWTAKSEAQRDPGSAVGAKHHCFTRHDLMVFLKASGARFSGFGVNLAWPYAARDGIA